MPTPLLTESERRALTRFNEQALRARSPLCPRWLARAIAERLTTSLSEALASSDTTRSAKAQAIVRHVVSLDAPVSAPANPASANPLGQ